MKNRIKLVSSLLVISFLLASCSNSANETSTNAESSETVQTTEIETTEETSETSETVESTTVEDDTYEPYEYEIDYYRVPELSEFYLDPDVIDGAVKVIDAVFNRETSVQLDLIYWKADFIYSLLDYMCPPIKVVAEYNIRNYNEDTGVMPLNYYYDEAATQEIFDTFEAKVDSYMSLLSNNDSEAMRALILYYAYTYDASYNYDLFSDPDAYTFQDLSYVESSYCAIVDNYGICSTLSKGLVFLYSQADINAEVTHNLSGENGSGTHAWVVAEIDGEYYYIDPTWGINDDDFGSVFYFGMTENVRFEYGGYTSENNEIWYIRAADSLEINDERFSNLHSYALEYVTDFIPNHNDQTIYIDADGYSITVNCS